MFRTNRADDLAAAPVAAPYDARRDRDTLNKDEFPMDTVGEQAEALILYTKAVFGSDESLETMATSETRIDGALHRLAKLGRSDQDRIHSFATAIDHIVDDLIRPRTEGLSTDAKANKKLAGDHEIVWVAVHFPIMEHAAEIPWVLATANTHDGAITTKLRPGIVVARGEGSFENNLLYNFGTRDLCNAVASDEFKSYMRLVGVQKEDVYKSFAKNERGDVLFVMGFGNDLAGKTSYLNITSVILPYGTPMVGAKGSMLPTSSHLLNERVYAAHIQRHEAKNKEIEAEIVRASVKMSQKGESENQALGTHRKGYCPASISLRTDPLASDPNIESSSQASGEQDAAAASIGKPSVHGTSAETETAQLSPGQGVASKRPTGGNVRDDLHDSNARLSSLEDDLLNEVLQKALSHEPRRSMSRPPNQRSTYLNASKQKIAKATLATVNSSLTRFAFSAAGAKRTQPEDEAGNEMEESEAKRPKRSL